MSAIFPKAMMGAYCPLDPPMGTYIHHVSRHCWKFSRSEVKVKVIYVHCTMYVPAVMTLTHLHRVPAEAYIWTVWRRGSFVDIGNVYNSMLIS